VRIDISHWNKALGEPSFRRRFYGPKKRARKLIPDSLPPPRVPVPLHPGNLRGTSLRLFGPARLASSCRSTVGPANVEAGFCGPGVLGARSSPQARRTPAGTLLRRRPRAAGPVGGPPAVIKGVRPPANPGSNSHPAPSIRSTPSFPGQGPHVHTPNSIMGTSDGQALGLFAHPGWPGRLGVPTADSRQTNGARAVRRKRIDELRTWLEGGRKGGLGKIIG